MGGLYFAILAALFFLSYALSWCFFQALPLPHLYHSGDFFMDFWNISFFGTHGDAYTLKSFYHPLLFSVIEHVGFAEAENSVSMRAANQEATVIVIGILFLSSLINYRALAGWKIHYGFIVICFFSTPIVFLVSRLNVLVFAYFIVSIIYSTNLVANNNRITFGILYSLLTIIKPYFGFFMLFKKLSNKDFALFLATFTFLSLLGAFQYNIAFNEDFSPFTMVSNLVSFSSGNKFPVYELFSLNYSPFSYVELATTSSDLTGMVWLGICGLLLNTLRSGVFWFLLILIALRSRIESERTTFLLITMALLTLVPTIGGYLMAITIPFIPEFKKITGKHFALIAAIIYCPVDFTLIASHAYLAASEVFGQSAGDVEIVPRILRTDMSAFAIVRPLALVLFWYSYLINIKTEGATAQT